jgi:acyl carrier protein
MNIREVIIKVMKEVAEEAGGTLTPDLNDHTRLLESGLDSLGFAVVVARLDQELGYDPFTLSEKVVYPRTLAEFVSFYEENKQAERGDNAA